MKQDLPFYKYSAANLMRLNGSWILLIAICFAYVDFATVAIAQSLSAGIEIEDFVVEDYYADQDQRKSVLYGASAVSSGEGAITINQLRLDLFQEDGSQNLRVETELCDFDEKKGLVKSNREVKISRSNGRFSLSGTGFEWAKDSRVARVTQSVQTRIDRSLLKDMRSDDAAKSSVQQAAATATADATSNATDETAPPLIVSSDRFEFDTETHLAVYFGNVRAVDGQGLDLKCDRLEARFSGASDEIEEILAIGSVGIQWEMEDRTGRAQSDLATYFIESGDGTLLMTGSPSWGLGEDTGSADRIIARPTQEEVVAEGSALLTLTLPKKDEDSSQGLFAFNLKGQEQPEDSSNKEPLAATSQQIRIRSGRYKYVSGESPEVVFEESPVLTDLATGWELSGGSLVFQLDADRLPKALLASAPVLLNQGETSLAGFRLNGDLISGQFEMESESGAEQRVVYSESGRRLLSDQMSFNNQDQSLKAHGNIWMEIEGVEVDMGIPGASSSPPEEEKDIKKETLVIQSISFEVEENAFVFEGSVRVKGSSWGLNTNWLKLSTGVTQTEGAEVGAESNSALENLEALGNVVLEQQGTLLYGDAMQYDPTTKIAVLNGNASMKSEKFRLTHAKTLTWNGQTGKVRSQGSSWLRGKIENRPGVSNSAIEGSGSQESEK